MDAPRRASDTLAMRQRKSRPTTQPTLGFEWTGCLTCDGFGEIISRWSQELGGARTRCPTCLKLGWVERRLGRPGDRELVPGKPHFGNEKPAEGLGKASAQDLRIWETFLEDADIDLSSPKDLGRPSRVAGQAVRQNRLDIYRQFEGGAIRIRSFPIVAGLTVLIGALAGVFLVFPLLPDSASDLVVGLQRRFGDVFGR